MMKRPTLLLLCMLLRNAKPLHPTQDERLPPPRLDANETTRGTTSGTGTAEVDDDVQSFLRDLSKIQALRQNDLTTLTTPCHLISRDSTYTITWTNADWEYHCSKPHVRYFRHVCSWPRSSTAEYVMPTVFCVALWSAVVSAVTRRHPPFASFLSRASLASGLLGTFIAPIALLLTLRTNRALDRLLDARKAWGSMIRASRSLMGLTCAYAMPLDRRLALLVGRYLAIFAWSLKGLLRGEEDGDVIRAALPPREVEWLLAQGNRPTAILCRLRKLCSELGRDHGLPPIPQLEMEERIYDLERSVGICSRILGSPIPPTYTRHTSRVLCLYMSLLPLALAGSGVSPLSIVMTSALASYVFVGIDEIGVEIEHPFPLLPMQQLASAVQINVMNQVVMMNELNDLE